MNLDLSNLINKDEKEYHFKGTVTSALEDYGIDDFKIIHPILYEGSVYKVDGFYKLTVNIKYRYESKCARCLKDSISGLETSLEERLEDKKNLNSTDDLDNIIVYDDGIVDIDKYVLIEVASSIPMKTLCTDNCKGLCPKCGIDLNYGQCDCSKEQTDPRFDKLRDFFLEK